MSKSNNQLSFFDNTAIQRPVLDTLLANLIGPVFHNKVLSLLILFVCNLQKTLVYLTISNRMFPAQDVFEGPFFTWVTWPIEYFLTKYEQVSSSYYALAFISGSLTLISTGLLVLMFVRSWQGRKAMKTLFRILRIIGFVYQSILFSILHSILMRMTQHEPWLGNLTNTDARYAIHMAIIVLLLLINAALALIFALACYEPLHFTQDIVAKRTKYYTLFSVVQKGVSLFFLSIISNSEKSGMAAALISFPIEFVSFIIFVWKLPYYDNLPLKIENIFAFMNITFSVINFVFAFVYTYMEFSEALIIILFLVPLSARFSFNYITKRIQKVLGKHVKQLKREDNFFLGFLAFENIIIKGSRDNKLLDQNTPNIQSFYLIEMIKEHKVHCKVQRCVCHYYCLPDPVFIAPGGNNTAREELSTTNPEKKERYTIKEQNELFEELMYLFKKEQLERAALAFPKWQLVKLNLANLIFMRNYENKIKALLLLYHMKGVGKTYALRAKATQIIDEIEEHIKAVGEEESRKSPGRLNIKMFIDSHSAYGELEKSIYRQAAKHTAFWDELEEQEPKMLKLLSISTAAEKEYKQIRKFWRKQQTGNLDPYFLKIFLLYGIYLKMIKNVEDESNKVLRKALYSYENIRAMESKHEGIHPVNMYNEENIIMRISLQNEKLGNIVSVSQNIENHLGYQKHLLIHKNVGAIMPEFIKSRHNDILMKYINTGKTSMLNRTRRVHAVHTNGYLIPFHIYITPFPYIDSDYTILALLKPTRSNDDVILTTTSGDIQGITERAAISLGIKKENAAHTNIASLCPKFKNINRVFNFFAFINYKTKEERIKVFEQSEQAYQDIITKKTNAFFKTFDEKIKKIAFKTMKFEAHRTFKGSPKTAHPQTKNHRTKNISLFHNKNQPRPSVPKEPPAESQAKPQEDEDDADKIIEKAFGLSLPFNRTETDNSADFSTKIQVPVTGTLGGIGTFGGLMNDKIINLGSSHSNNDSSPELPPSSRVRGKSKDSTPRSLPSEDNFSINYFGSSMDDTSYKPMTPSSRLQPGGRQSILAADYLKRRGSAANKFIQASQDFSSQAKLALEQEYNILYNSFVNRGQILKFTFFDSQQKIAKELFYLVKIYNEKVFDDTLRVIILSTDDTNNRKNSENPEQLTFTQSSSDLGDEASGHQQSPGGAPKNSKLSIFHRNREAHVESPGLKKDSDKKVTFQKFNSSQHTIELVDVEEKKKVLENPIMNGLYKKACELVSGVENSRDEISIAHAKAAPKHQEIKVEKAINSKQLSKALLFISKTVLLMFFSTILFLIWIAVNTTQGITESWDVVELLNSTYLRTVHILEMNRRVQQYNLTQLGYLYIYTEDTIMSAFDTCTESVKDLNNDVREQLHSLQTKFRDQIFDQQLEVRSPVNPLPNSEPIFLNPFELTDQIIETAIALEQLQQQNASSSEIQAMCIFLEENIINNDIIGFDQLPDIEIKGSTDVFTSSTILNEFVLVFGIMLGLVVFVMMVKVERDFMRRKRLTLSALLTVSPNEIKQYKKYVTQVTRLMESKTIFSTLPTKKSQSLRETPRKKETKRNKHGDFKGMYRNLFNVMVKAWIVLLSLNAMIVYLFIESTSINGLFDSDLQKVNDVYFNYLTVSLGFNALYQYVSGSSNTMRGNPIDTEITSIFTDLKLNSNLFELLRGSDANLPSNIDVFDTGNLCSVLFNQAQQCQSLGGGVMTSGLTSLEIYFATQITNIKNEYDITDKTVDDLITVFKFQGFTDADQIFSLYGKATYEALMSAVLSNFYDSANNIKTTLVRAIIIFVFVTLLILYPIWKIVENAMIQDRINVRRVLRMVSPAYVMSNKSFKGALVRDANLVKFSSQL